MITQKSKKTFLVVLAALFVLFSFATMLSLPQKAYAAAVTYDFESTNLTAPSSDWTAAYEVKTYISTIGGKTETGGSITPKSGSSMWGGKSQGSGGGYCTLTSKKSFSNISNIAFNLYSTSDSLPLFTIKIYSDASCTTVVKTVVENENPTTSCKNVWGTKSYAVSPEVNGYIKISASFSSSGKYFGVDDLTITNTAPIVKTKISAFDRSVTSIPAVTQYESTLDGVVAQLPTTVNATVAGTTTPYAVTIPSTAWACTTTGGYNPDVAGTYTFAATIPFDSALYELDSTVTGLNATYTVTVDVEAVVIKDITSYDIAALTTTFEHEEYSLGAVLETLKATFPTSVNANILGEATTVTIPVAATSWSCTASDFTTAASYNANESGTYYFAAPITFDARYYKLSTDTVTPFTGKTQIEVTVTITEIVKQSVTAIAETLTTTKEVISGSLEAAESTVKATFPTTFTATVTGEPEPVVKTLTAADWTCSPTYSATTGASYIFTATLFDSLYYDFEVGVSGTATVTVKVISNWTWDETNQFLLYQDGTTPSSTTANVLVAGDTIARSATFAINWAGSVGTEAGVYVVAGQTDAVNISNEPLGCLSTYNRLGAGDADLSGKVAYLSDNYGTFGNVTMKSEFVSAGIKIVGDCGFRFTFKLTITGDSSFNLTNFLAAYPVVFSVKTDDTTPFELVEVANVSTDDMTISGNTITVQYEILNAFGADNTTYNYNSLTDNDIRTANLKAAAGLRISADETVTIIGKSISMSGIATTALASVEDTPANAELRTAISQYIVSTNP